MNVSAHCTGWQSVLFLQALPGQAHLELFASWPALPLLTVCHIATVKLFGDPSRFVVISPEILEYLHTGL